MNTISIILIILLQYCRIESSPLVPHPKRRHLKRRVQEPLRVGDLHRSCCSFFFFCRTVLCVSVCLSRLYLCYPPATTREQSAGAGRLFHVVRLSTQVCIEFRRRNYQRVFSNIPAHSICAPPTVFFHHHNTAKAHRSYGSQKNYQRPTLPGQP